MRDKSIMALLKLRRAHTWKKKKMNHLKYFVFFTCLGLFNMFGPTVNTLLLDSEQNYISPQVMTHADASKKDSTSSSVEFVYDRTQSFLEEDYICRKNSLDIFFNRRLSSLKPAGHFTDENHVTLSNNIFPFDVPTQASVSTTQPSVLTTLSTTNVDKKLEESFPEHSQDNSQNIAPAEETIFQLVPDQEVRESEEQNVRELQKISDDKKLEDSIKLDSVITDSTVEDSSKAGERYIVKAVPKVFGNAATNDDKAVNIDTLSVEASLNIENVESSNTDVEIIKKVAAVIDEQKSSDELVADLFSQENETAEGTEPSSSIAQDIKQPETPNKTEPDIPSFREWTQKALEEEQKKREEERRKRDEEREKKKQLQQQQQQQLNLKQAEVGGNVNTTGTASAGGSPRPPQTPAPVRLKKNFASTDCGAKIVSANPESQGAPNVLSPYRDEYMLNKCTDRAWFVVELCESIKALKIEIANFELYSSVPHEIRVSLGNSFPTREWSIFGNFRAEDERNLQFFAAEGDVFGKYVKVEILSHHGSEHYCPISQFKIYGISEIELIGRDDDDDKNDDDDDDSTTPNDVITADQTPPINNNVLKFIKEKMGETLEKVVGVFKPKDQNSEIDMFQALNKTSLVGTTFAYEITCPGCTTDVSSDVYFLLATNYEKMSAAVSHTNIRAALSKSSVCENYGIRVTSDDKLVSKYIGHNLVKFYTTLFGASRIVALCNVLAIEQGLGRLIGSRLEPEIADEVNSDVNNTTQKEDNDKNSKVDKSENSSAQGDSGNNSEKLTLSRIETSTKSGDMDTTMSSVSIDVSSSMRNEDKPILDKDTIVTDATPYVDKILEPIAPTPVTQTLNGLSPSEMPKTVELESKDMPEVGLVPPSDPSNIHSEVNNNEEASNGNGNKPFLPGQGRESVWQKLSNRIKTLERNVSLSSGYLEELSVQYKKQIEDLQMSVRLASDSLTMASKSRERDQFAMKHLQNEVANLSAVVANLTLQMEALRTWAVVAHLIVLIAEATIGGLFLVACYKRLKRHHSDIIPAMASLTSIAPSSHSQPVIVHVNGKIPSSFQHASTVASTPLKRGYSLEDLIIDEADDEDDVSISGKTGQFQRRMSLDNLSSNNSRPKVNGVMSTDIPLTRKQRRRIQRRTSLARNCFVSRQINGLVFSNGHQRDSQDSDDATREWTPVTRAGSIDRTPPPALETITTLPNGRTFISNVPYFNFSTQAVSTSNAFGILNNSMHDDPTPIKERSLNYRSPVDHHPSGVSSKKLKFSPEVVDNVTLYVDNNHLAAPKLNSSHRSGILKRSKSTSPTRSKNQAVKQRDMFKHFNPETADWIKH